MTNLESLAKALEILGKLTSNSVATESCKKSSANESPKKSKAKGNKKIAVPKTLSDEYISCKYSELLDNIKYYPDGDAPKEHNSLFSYSEYEKNNGKVFWYCSDKMVAFLDSKNMTNIISPNAFTRLCESISRRWALERDWIPPYRYSLEDNMQEVWIIIQEALKNQTDKSQIIGDCFRRLDVVNDGIPFDRHKTQLVEENFNDADRLMYASLFTGDIASLTLNFGENGDILDLPTSESLDQYSTDDCFKFLKIAELFERTRIAHKSAHFEKWLCAQCNALNVPRKDAIQFVYGDSAIGVKKYHRCEVAFSKHCVEVANWLLEEVKNMQEEGIADGLEKWVEIIEKIKNQTIATALFGEVDKYSLMKFDEDGKIKKGIEELIVINPIKVLNMFQEIIAEKNAEDAIYGKDKSFEDYLENFGKDTDIDVNEEVAKCSVELPF